MCCVCMRMHACSEHTGCDIDKSISTNSNNNNYNYDYNFNNKVYYYSLLLLLVVAACSRSRYVLGFTSTLYAYRPEALPYRT